MSLPLGIFGRMMCDRARNRALARGIRSLVRPGDVVVDVGAGAGFLSILAARAGARKVYALEATRMASVARALVERNECAGQVEVVQGWSYAWQPPELADVILSETLGYSALDEGFRRTIADARDRMLRPGGRILPASVELLAAPVEAVPDTVDPDYLDTVENLDFSPFGELYRQLPQRAYVPRESELAPVQRLVRLDSRTLTAEGTIPCRTRFAFSRVGTLAGFALWFDAVLADGVDMSSRDPQPANHWGQTFLPVPRPMPVVLGELVDLELEMDDRSRFRLSWSATSPRVAEMKPCVASPEIGP
jgi:predicted RNA methylase